MSNDRNEQAAALGIRDMAFWYDPSQAGAPVVDIGSFQVAAGEQVLVRAASGGGKSTLLQLIAGVLEPSRGVIEIGGKSIHALTGSARDRFRGGSIGMVFQTFQLLDGFSARENVEVALLMGGVAESEHALRAGELLTKLGLDRVDVPVEELSVGQQQRVAVARAVACKPALVLADEPTASLDVENGNRAMDVIQSACAEIGAALLCVSHDPAMAERFTRQVDLNSLRSEAMAKGGAR
ncbi:MAG: ABC transporter ATP-binding protein [Planctomycetes bacterium]|nr:ABC transporter ATP-binding protein [Planctomycetota bacterium]